MPQLLVTCKLQALLQAPLRAVCERLESELWLTAGAAGIESHAF